MAKRLPESITLDHSIEIYIPTQCRCGQMLPEDVRAEVLDEVKGAMHGWFGGVSKKDDIRVEEIEGAWPLKSGEIANERVDVVYSNASAEALEEHFEELPALAASIANRLTQESIAFRVNNKMTLMPGQDVNPHRCAGGVSPGSLPVARQPNEKERMRAIQASLQRISSVRDARDLFCNVLHYEFKDEQIHTVQWPDSLKECLAPRTSPQIIADQNGFKILYLQLAEDYLRKGHERQVVQRIIKDDPTLRGLVVVSDIDQKEWHLVNAKFEKEDGKKERLRLRRMRVGPEQSVRTAVERLKDVDVEHLDEGITAAQLQDLHDKAFDVESVSKDFFNEISNWYFWALSEVEFPDDMMKDGDDEKHRATSLIRFLTRIIFCWFLKEKNLIPDSLFKEKDLVGILKDLDPDSCSYHQGILQNLFFATLNQRMGKDSKGQPYRAFAKDEGFLKNKSTYGVDTLYRYEEHFKDEGKALSYFADVPFLNGGLFECLDRTDEDTGKKLYVDGFSRNKKKRARVPNRLFFGNWQPKNLSAAYGDPSRGNTKVRGLLNILLAYNFTVEENTPIDEEIALDPELLGKVFENLLASYNEETKKTARKQTGSFYTPRPIVEYMVDESLKAHLISALTTLGRAEAEADEQLDLLLGYTDEETSFYEGEISALLEAIHTCKILDPACGSGAFPIGMLQKLVHVVHKLDPENARWKQLQIDQASNNISDASACAAAIKAIEHDFEENGDDYGRKLYLIENCLYGVDIQPIAIQISKLRFFISLICDQKTNRDKAKNHGIRALPNLETKFVVANTLIGLPEMDQMALVDPRVNAIEVEIESLYHRHFTIQRRDQKQAIQQKLRGLRNELGKVLAESLGSSQKAQHLADWDPFDSQVCADFFDPHWMFGKTLANGFNIVIGNPPYIQLQANGGALADLYENAGYETFGRTADIYCLFYERGFQLLTDQGYLCYITSNQWMRTAYGKKLRQYLSEKTAPIKLLDMGEGVFEATTNTNILLVEKGESTCSLQAVNVQSQSMLRQENGLKWTKMAPSSEPWTVLDIREQGIISKMMAAGKQLKDWDIAINRGVVTGFNEAFIIDDSKKEELVRADPSCAKIIWPVLRGRDIKRYRKNLSGLWLIGTFPALNLNIDDYPSVKAHLRSFGRKLHQTGEIIGRDENGRPIKSRKKTQNAWFETQDAISYYKEFNKKMISWGNLCQSAQYTIIDEGFCISAPSPLITPASPYLLAVLNSKLGDYFIRNMGVIRSGGYFEYKPMFVEQLPVPIITDNEQKPFEELTAEIIKLKKENAETDTSPLEAKIERLIYELYELTPEEIVIVESEA